MNRIQNMEKNSKRLFTILSLLICISVCMLYGEESSKDTTKNLGDQLIEFQKHRPQKYDVGLIKVQSAGNDQWNTYYYRIKKDGNLARFVAHGLNTNILYSAEIGSLTDYLSIHSKYDNAYWKSGAAPDQPLTLTTWTNKGIPPEENNSLFREMNSVLKTDPKLNIINCMDIAVQDGDDHYCITNETGQKIASFSLVRDAQGRIIRQDFVNDVPRYPFGVTNVPLIGSVYHFGYETNLGVPFFPNWCATENIYKEIKEGKETVFTNKKGTNFYVYLNLNPDFDKSKFELIPNGITNYMHYWVEGTNILYTNYYGRIDRLLTQKEADELNKAYEMQKSNYRYLYFILAFVIILITFILTIKIKK